MVDAAPTLNEDGTIGAPYAGGITASSAVPSVVAVHTSSSGNIPGLGVAGQATKRAGVTTVTVDRNATVAAIKAEADAAYAPHA